MNDTVLVETKDGVTVITLNRPERRNAINEDLLRNFYTAIETASHDNEIHVIIVTGSGKSFCSGLDLAVLNTDNLMDPRGDNKGVVEIMEECPIPIIGAINGHAITGGFEIALNCDFLIASENASFADTHVKVGIHPGWGMTQLLQQAVGQRMAKQLSFTGQFLSAEEALRLRLVNEVVPHDQLMIRSREIALEICSGNQEMLSIINDLIEYRNSTTMQAALNNELIRHKSFLKKLLGGLIKD